VNSALVKPRSWRGYAASVISRVDDRGGLADTLPPYVDTRQ